MSEMSQNGLVHKRTGSHSSRFCLKPWRMLGVVMALVLTMAIGTTPASADVSQPVGNGESPVVLVAPDTYEFRTADGVWLGAIDDQSETITVISPEGVVEVFDLRDPMFDGPQSASSLGSDVGDLQLMAKNSTACIWTTYVIELIQSVGWGAAVAIIIANPVAAAAVGGILLMGRGFFWNWVRSHC